MWPLAAGSGFPPERLFYPSHVLWRVRSRHKGDLPRVLAEETQIGPAEEGSAVSCGRGTAASSGTPGSCLIDPIGGNSPWSPPAFP